MSVAPPPCPTLTPIPLPADDYDRPHTINGALASLGAATSSFDAVMDSITTSARQQERRVHALEWRIQRCREWIGRLEKLAEIKANGLEVDVHDTIFKVYCPSSYEEALKGVEMDLADIRGGTYVNSDLYNILGAQLSNDDNNDALKISAVEAARNAADKAVRHALEQDARTDDGEAVPSDAWLDQASMGIAGLTHSLKVFEDHRRVPMLLGSLLKGKAFSAKEGSCMTEMEYRAILDSLAMRASNTVAYTPASLADLANINAIGLGSDGDDESVHSATSRMSTLSVASNISSTGRITAGQRRRLHKQQQQLLDIKAGEAIIPEAKSTDPVTTDSKSFTKTPAPTGRVKSKPNLSTVSGRLQAFSGSQPYLCEVLHDCYGIGAEPPKGLIDCSGFSARGTREGGSEFYPPPSSVTDLVVFNTTRDSYGMANRQTGS